MDDIATATVSIQRFPMLLLAAFATLALVLAAVGMYGVISYSVTQRVLEIGIRVALGAGRPDVLRMIVGEGVLLSLIGIASGIAAATILAPALPSFSHLLYGIKATDPITFLITSVVLICTGTVACYLPARRAARLDPMVALRVD